MKHLNPLTVTLSFTLSLILAVPFAPRACANPGLGARAALATAGGTATAGAAGGAGATTGATEAGGAPAAAATATIPETIQAVLNMAGIVGAKEKTDQSKDQDGKETGGARQGARANSPSESALEAAKNAHKFRAFKPKGALPTSKESAEIAKSVSDAVGPNIEGAMVDLPEYARPRDLAKRHEMIEKLEPRLAFPTDSGNGHQVGDSGKAAPSGEGAAAQTPPAKRQKRRTVLFPVSGQKP